MVGAAVDTSVGVAVAERGHDACAFEAVTKRFGGHAALADVTLGIAAGEVHAIAGENGAGKSTLIKILAGVHRPDAGRVLVNGEPVDMRVPRDATALGFGFLHQRLDLVGDLSVRENVLLGSELPRRALGRIDWPEVERRAQDALELVGAGVRPQAMVRDLTMAQQQLVAFARVLLVDPRVIVLDEPTASLGEEDTEHLLSLVEARRAAGHSIIFISHRLEEVLRIADRISILRDGRLVTTTEASAVTRSELVHLLGGAEDHGIRLAPDRARRGRPRLEVVDLEGPGLDHAASLTIDEGEVVGLAGLVGAGRTTLANMIAGIAPVTAGEVRMAGERRRIRDQRDAVAHGIVLVPEERAKALVPDFDIEQNMSLGHLDRYARRGVVIDHGRERGLGERYTRELAIKVSGADRTTRHLSGGNQQKVLLARALDLAPSVLILDEPTAGIDIGTKEHIYRLIRELADGGMSVLVISSELEELPLVADRILTLRRGRIMSELPGSSTRADIVARLFSEAIDG